jgi:ligand-binding SRPBCC domain-containing protein
VLVAADFSLLLEAFAFFQDPYNLARITPPSLAFRIANRERVEMRRGAEITYGIRVAGVPLSWKTIITAYDPPSLFVDEQAAGPYRFWRHTHTFRPTPAGTIVADRVDYALPFGWAGRIVHALYVARRLRRIFDYRQEMLARIFERPSTER